MGHEVESSHQEDEVNQQEPVPLQRNLALGDESACQTALLCSECLSGPESMGLGQAQPESNDQNWWARAKPVQRPPTVRGGVDETAGEGCCEQVSKGVSLLEHTGNDTSGSFWAVLEGGCGSISVESAHGNTEKSTHSKKLTVSLSKPGAKFEDDEENVVNHKGPSRRSISAFGSTGISPSEEVIYIPFPSIAIGSDTEDGRADGSEHEHQSNTPGDVRVRFSERLSEVGDRQRYGEEIKGIPRPGEESDQKEHPLLGIQHGKQFEWIGGLVHGRLEGGDSGGGIFGWRHVSVRELVFLRLIAIGTSARDSLLVDIDVGHGGNSRWKGPSQFCGGKKRSKTQRGGPCVREVSQLSIAFRLSCNPLFAKERRFVRA